MNSVEIMGVLNATPDSFSDGGNYLSLENALQHCNDLLCADADIIDVGGESSRPYAEVVELEEELRRVIPIVRAIKQEHRETKISVDTYKPEVMQQVLELGVEMINDIYALQKVEEQNSIGILQNSDCDICLMHMQNTPETMQNSPKYTNIIQEISDFFEKRIEYCLQNNIDINRIIIDPGFGFGKSYDDNIEILNQLRYFQKFNVRILVGLSKKSMFDTMLGGRSPDGRVVASTVAAAIAYTKGADIIRTHNPQEVSDALKVYQSLQ